LLYVRGGFAERLNPPGIGGSAAVWEDAAHYQLRPGADRFLEYEVPVAAHIGLGVAIDHALAIGIESVAARVQDLGAQLRRDLAAIDGVEVRDGGTRLSGIVTFTSEHATPAQLSERATAAGINVWVSNAPAARLDMTPPNSTSVVRASPHYFNTGAELERLVHEVAAMARS